MKILRLPAHLQADLDWSALEQEALASSEKIIWEFEFRLEEVSLEDTAAFYTFSVAMETFSSQLFKKFKEQTEGVILFRGSYAYFRHLQEKEEVESYAAAASLLGDYLHRLASFLPDDIPLYCLFEGEDGFFAAERAHLLSKERFWSFHLSLEPEENFPVGILLPPDEVCTPAVLTRLETLFETLKGEKYRVLPEGRLTELWNGLDQLHVLEEAVTGRGKRKLQGFEAAGGVVISH